MIRPIIKHFLINSVSIYLVSLAVSGIYFADGINTLLLAAVALTVAALVIKPVINILILPINLITFGLFRWVGFAIALYVVTLLVPTFKLLNFHFAGFSSYLFTIPAISIEGILAFIVFSFLISTIASIIGWALK
jgi:putative membrane protein